VNPALEVQSVTLRRNGRPILDSISLTVTSGTLAAIVGPNGSGKSTLLRVLAGLWRASSGTVLLDGLPLERFRRRDLARRVAFVPQDTRIDFSFTVEEVVAMGRYAHRRRFAKEGREDHGAIEAAIERCDVSHLRAFPANALSGGERQRVLIARSLAAMPEVVVLDEPTASLDIEHALDILQLCRELACEGRAVVLATHDLDAAAHYAGTVELLDHGRLVASGAPEDVLSPASVRRVFGVRGEVVHTVDGAPHLVFQAAKTAGEVE
jgi:iron complex transport system ATP-binding protein